MHRLRSACEEASPCQLIPESGVELPIDHLPAEQGSLHRIDSSDRFVVAENLPANWFINAAAPQALEIGADQGCPVMEGDRTQNLVTLAERGSICGMKAQQPLQQVNIVRLSDGAGRDRRKGRSAMQAFMRRSDGLPERIPHWVAEVSAGRRENHWLVAARNMEIG